MNDRSLFITMAVIVDIIVTVSIVSFVMKKRGLLKLLGLKFQQLKPFANESRDLAANFLRANYSGNPDELPGVLDQLLVQLEQKAQEQNLPLDREMLKLFLAQALRGQDGVSMNDVQSAMRKVA